MTETDPKIPVYVPSLVSLLKAREKAKGEPLTEAEVLEIRDRAIRMSLPLSEAARLAKSRGYDDLDPEECWEEWQRARQEQR